MSSYKGKTIERELILDNIDKTSYLFVDEDDEYDSYLISFVMLKKEILKNYNYINHWWKIPPLIFIKRLTNH
ncbi:hypothetical protein CoNPh11_CDS0161 [Staphylococcus phage S-CoN_Ph11]|nr:hypothetical protein CoNPh11_CDS0161 [Staphylococcus phage S-CoN_Ph11]